MLIACALPVSLVAQAARAQRPDIVVMIDEQGNGDLSCRGSTKLLTPNLDLLCEESARLTSDHVDPTYSPMVGEVLWGQDLNPGAYAATFRHTLAGGRWMFLTTLWRESGEEHGACSASVRGELATGLPSRRP